MVSRLWIQFSKCAGLSRLYIPCLFIIVKQYGRSWPECWFCNILSGFLLFVHLTIRLRMFKHIMFNMQRFVPIINVMRLIWRYPVCFAWRFADEPIEARYCICIRLNRCHTVWRCTCLRACGMLGKVHLSANRLSMFCWACMVHFETYWMSKKQHIIKFIIVLRPFQKILKQRRPT